MLQNRLVLLCCGLIGCSGTNWQLPQDFVFIPINTELYTIATWQKINNPNDSHIHVYIEGDGNAFNAYGQPTNDPTPKGTLIRELATRDSFPNVVYMARPCQFIMTNNCNQTDWTTGRFSQNIITAQTDAIKKIAHNSKITLIGYSGGAMVSGLIIQQNPDMQFEQWITVAGVLNHSKWTKYFGDEPLTESLDMTSLPKIPQKHFIGGRDKVVPYQLAIQWANVNDIILIDYASHNDFGKLELF